MKPTPLLDSWQKPKDAGAPVAVFATTFALDPDFFEQNCLARFLEVTSVNEDTGSVDDIVASIELQELLRSTSVTVLSDRSAPVQRSSLLWDLLGCHVPDGLLHAKVAVLIWEKQTRVILGSANLTAAGYRRQIELGLCADLGPECIFPKDVLSEIASELESYLTLVPGRSSRAAVFLRAESTLSLFRQRVERQPATPQSVRVAFAPTNPTSRPLEQLYKAWSGSQPARAIHLSPFWDSSDTTVLSTVKSLLTARPVTERSQQVAVVLGPGGQTSFSKFLHTKVDSVRELKAVDNEIRTLHAKCLLITSKGWVAALVGSSNHTNAGLGLSRNRHREINVWLGARADSKEGAALSSLLQLGKELSGNEEEVEPTDEDESLFATLPDCFGLCQIMESPDQKGWQLQLEISNLKSMPEDWSITIGAGELPFLTRKQWETNGEPQTSIEELRHGLLPMFVLVRWSNHVTPWAVVAGDRSQIPYGAVLSDLRASHLLDALAAGRSIAQIVREHLERQKRSRTPETEFELDPLKRFEIERSLLRKGRALAASLTAMQRRLERPVTTTEALHARLAGPLGPTFVATKVVEAANSGEQSRAEAMFTIAEIALTVGRSKWAPVLESIDHREGYLLIEQVLSQLDALRGSLEGSSDAITSYAQRAISEARKCLNA